MKEITIRKSELGDLKAICNIANELWNLEKNFDENIKPDYYLSSKGKYCLKKYIVSKNKISLVAIVDNKIVGFCDGYIIEDDIAYYSKIAFLNRICVKEEYRKNKIGTKLLNEFTEYVSKLNARYIKLNAFENNLPAINFYYKNGFKEYSIYYMKKI